MSLFVFLMYKKGHSNTTDNNPSQEEPNVHHEYNEQVNCSLDRHTMEQGEETMYFNELNQTE